MTDDDIHGVWLKYRYGYTHFIDRDNFMKAVRELLTGEKSGPSTRR